MRLVASLLAVASLQLGCYYAHLARGQTRLLLARRSLEAVREDPQTERSVLQGLVLVEQVRAFAGPLGLETGDHYTSYAEWPGDRIVTVVVATEPHSIEARPFRFPLIGALPYKGFFDPERAAREADDLVADGLDVCSLPVRAYSTLGWFDDPLTGPMLRQPEGRLIEVVLHELVHANVFAREAADFNEGLATFVGQEAAVRFRETRGDGTRARSEVRDERILARLLADYRDQVAALYRELEPGAPERAERRAELERDARAAIANLSVTTFDAAAYAGEARLNDACQALAGTYEGDLPRYEALLRTLDGDLAALIDAARAAAEQTDPRAVLFAPLGESAAPAGP